MKYEETTEGTNKAQRAQRNLCGLSVSSVVLRSHQLVALVFALFVSALGQSSIEEQRQELYQTRERLEAVERRIVNLRQERSAAERSIVEDEERLATIRRLSYQIEQAQQEKEATIARIRRAMFDIQEQIGLRKQELASRLIATYKYGRLFELDVLLSAKSLPEIYKKLYYLRMLAEADKARVDELYQLQADMRAQQDHFKYAAAALRQLQDEYDQKRRVLQADKDFKSAAVKSVQHEVTVNEARAEQLAAAAEELEGLIQRLEANQASSGATPEPSAITGSLPWPAPGKVKVSFGEQGAGSSGTSTRNSGIVIECTPGSPVKAVAKGRVSYAEEFMTYGNLVILDHGDGSFSVYGSLKDIAVAVNDAIAEGDIVGHANATLYFELRKAGGPVDPMGYLK